MDNYIGYIIYSQIRDENLSLFRKYFDFFEKADFRLPNRREPKDLFPLNVTLKPVKMGVEIFERGNHRWIILIFL